MTEARVASHIQVDLFLQACRKKMLTRLARDDIPKGVLPAVMETWLEIESDLAARLTIKEPANG